MKSLAQYWADWLMEECVRLGATHVGIAPGARSAALVIAASNHPELTITVHFDERALSFWALGYGKASGKPAIVITTSGTAVANLLPAVIEASQSSIPMLVLTSDRPHELHDIGANQTIAQEGIFNNTVRWAITLPAPTADISPAYVLATVDYAWFKATGIHPGPVQLNCMFREPLLNGPIKPEGYDAPLEKWSVSKEAFTQYPKQPHNVDTNQIERCKAILSQAKTGCIVVGTVSKEDADYILKTAEKLQWPIIAEGGSGLSVVDHPLLYTFPNPAQESQYDVVLTVGDPITLKSVLTPTSTHQKTWITIHPSPTRQDAFLHGGERLIGKISNLLHLITESMAPATPIPFETNKIDIEISTSLTEETAIHAITSYLNPEIQLFCANSLPIRLLTTHAARHLKKPISTFVNRGASGIDGNIATIAGIQAHEPTPLFALLGDQTTLHDLTSLNLIAQLNHPTFLFVINNYGGGIFSKVLSESAIPHKDYFQAPHQLSFEYAAKQFNVRYAEIATLKQLITFLDEHCKPQMMGTPILVEICCKPKENEQLHE